MALANRHLVSTSKMPRIFSSQKLELYFITGSCARKYEVPSECGLDGTVQEYPYGPTKT